MTLLLFIGTYFGQNIERDVCRHSNKFDSLVANNTIKIQSTSHRPQGHQRSVKKYDGWVPLQLSRRLLSFVHILGEWKWPKFA